MEETKKTAIPYSKKIIYKIPIAPFIEKTGRTTTGVTHLEMHTRKVTVSGILIRPDKGKAFTIYPQKRRKESLRKVIRT